MRPLRRCDPTLREYQCDGSRHNRAQLCLARLCSQQFHADRRFLWCTGARTDTGTLALQHAIQNERLPLLNDFLALRKPGSRTDDSGPPRLVAREPVRHEFALAVDFNAFTSPSLDFLPQVCVCLCVCVSVSACAQVPWVMANELG